MKINNAYFEILDILYSYMNVYTHIVLTCFNCLICQYWLNICIHNIYIYSVHMIKQLHLYNV